MGRRRDVFRAIAGENRLREELASQRLPPPESTIGNDVTLYGEIVTENEFIISRREAEADFASRVEQAEADIAARINLAQAELGAEQARLEQQQATIEEAEYQARANAETDKITEAQKEFQEAERDAAEKQAKRGPLIAALLVGAAILFTVMQ